MSLRQRSVYATGEVAHQWAKQSPLCARNAKHTLQYNGTVLYSYDEPIANLVTFNDKQCVLLTQHHSDTTDRHWNLARRAAPDLPAFTVDDLFIGKRTICHAANLLYYKRNIKQSWMASQAKDPWLAYHLASMRFFVAEANQYAEFFGKTERFSAPNAQ